MSERKNNQLGEIRDNANPNKTVKTTPPPSSVSTTSNKSGGPKEK